MGLKFPFKGDYTVLFICGRKCVSIKIFFCILKPHDYRRKYAEISWNLLVNERIPESSLLQINFHIFMFSLWIVSRIIRCW